VTERWTRRGLYLTERVWSVLRVCTHVGLLIGRGGASGHSRPDVSSRSRCLLDSNRTLALWRPIHLTARPVTSSLESYSDLTSASGQLQDQRIRSSFACPVCTTSATAAKSCA
jgi:hypothetical protein